MRPILGAGLLDGPPVGERQRGVPVTAYRASRWAARNWRLVVGGALVSCIVAAIALAPEITPYNPTVDHLVERLKSPLWAGGNWSHPLGTDAFGRDVLARLLYGGRYSLSIAAVAVACASCIGISLGTLSGYFGSWWETVIMRVSDAQQALPSVLLAVVVIAIFGGGIFKLMVVLAVTAWVQYSRIIFSLARSLRRRDFVIAATSLGAKHLQVLRWHILPNLVPTIIVISTLLLARMLLLEAGLSFLGLGVPEPTPDWGSMISEGQESIFTTPWLVTIPGLAITITVWSMNMLGDGVRRLLDVTRRLNDEV